MERSSREWLVPLTGIVFFVLLIVSFIVIGNTKDADHPPGEIANWYIDNKDAIEIGALISVIAATFLIFFAAYLRKVLVAAEGEGSMLPILVVIGLSIVGVGAAVDNMLLFAAAEAADKIPAPEIQTIQAIWDNDFLPLVLGVTVFLWSAGLSVLRSGVLPKWLGWVAIVFGVVSVTPIGFVGAMGAALWILVVSVLLSLRARSAASAPPAATSAPPAA